MRKTFLLLLNLCLSCVLVFAADRTWTFTSWSEATLANMAADATWTTVSDTRYANANAIAAGEIIVANSVEVQEIAGLTFSNFAADRIRIDYGDPETDGSRMLLNGGNIEIRIPNCEMDDIITVTMKTASGNGDARGLTATSASFEGSTDEANAEISGVKFTATYKVTESGTVVLKTTGGLQFFEISITGVVASSPTISRQSGSADQDVFVGQSIEEIKYKMGGTANDATLVWTAGSTPDGITVSPLTDGVITISGAPTTVGVYPYTVTSTDGTLTSDPLGGTITVNAVGSKPLIAFVTNLAPAEALLEGDNKIIAKLSESYDVVKVDATVEGTDYSVYAAIVLSGAPGSGSVGLPALKSPSKPFVNLKTWMFRASPLWAWGNADNVAAETLEGIVNTVAVSDASHPVFDGMGLANGSDIIFATNSSHAAFRVLIPVLEWNDGNEANVTTLATVKGSDQDGKTVIGEITTGTTMSGSAITQKNIFFGVSEAAGPYFTDELLTMINNAVAYVIGGEDSIDSEKMDNAGKVEVAAEYYDLMGRTISGEPKGIVIKKSIYEDGSVSFGKAYIK